MNSVASCEDLKFWPDNAICSGHGNCTRIGDISDQETLDLLMTVDPEALSTQSDRFICQCDPEWTGIGDLWPYPMLRCDKWINGISIPWIIAIVICSCTFITSIAALILRYKKGQFTKKKMFTYPIVSLFIVSIASLLFAILGIRKTLNPKSAIGFEVSNTLLFSLSSGLFWISSFLFGSLFLKVLTLQARQFKTSGKFGSWQTASYTVPVIAMFSAFTAALPLFMLATNNPDSKLIVVYIFSLNIAIVISTLGTFLSTFMNAIGQQLHEVSATSDSMKTFEGRLKFAKLQIIQASVMNTILSLIFGFWPFLTSVYTFELPIGYGSGFLAGIPVIWLISSKTSSQGSSKASFQHGNTKSSSSKSFRNNKEIVSEPSNTMQVGTEVLPESNAA